jgi:hypothetical protein
MPPAGRLVLHGKSAGAAWAAFQIKGALRFGFAWVANIDPCGRSSDLCHTVTASTRVDFHPSIAPCSVPIYVLFSVNATDAADIKYSHRTPIVTHAPHTSIAQSANHWTKGSTRDSGCSPTHPLCGGIDTWRDGNVAEFRVRLRAREQVVLIGTEVRHTVPFAGRNSCILGPLDVDKR